jgi:CheY-like chemotaxis protein
VSKRILLIDSDESFAQGLSHAISARGFVPTLATNSEQGMSLAKQEGPDLIVVCVEAQPTNGYMLCTRLKKDDQLKNIPVILTSANATQDSFEKHKKLKTRAEEYLIKPFAPVVMLEKAAGLLGVALPPEQHEEEIVAVDDEPLGLGDLVPGEDEPISLSEADVAEARGGAAEETLIVEEVEEVEEVQDLQEAHGADHHDDDLAMFDKAFDSLGGAAAQASQPPPEETRRFGDLSVVADEPAHTPPTEITAPDDADILNALHDDQAAASADDEVRHHLEVRIAELEQQLAERDAELVQARKGTASSSETIRLKDAKNKADKENLRLKEELTLKDKELVDLQERETQLESQAQQLKDDAVKREAAAKALQQRADALAAAAKKFERELTAARDESKKTATDRAKASEMEKAHDELKRKHDDAIAEARKHQERAGALDAELAGTREVHSEELETARAETQKAQDEILKSRDEIELHKAELALAHEDVDKHKADTTAAKAELDAAKAEVEAMKRDVEALHQELETARGELETSHHELTGVRAEVETLRTEVAALTGEKDLMSEERDDLKRQAEEALSQATQNEERAVKSYAKMKNDEKLREKTRKALQIALQLLEDDAESDADDASEKRTA